VIGFHHLWIETERFVNPDGTLHYDRIHKVSDKLVSKEHRQSDAPIYARIPYGRNMWERGVATIDNPLLMDLGVSKILDPKTVYLWVEEYIGYVNSHKGEGRELTDKEKIVQHGFDTKKSFRNM
jgi:hypothetical protein